MLCSGKLVLGYNKPINFDYWENGLAPLFVESTLGSLPHSVSTPFNACPALDPYLVCCTMRRGAQRSGPRDMQVPEPLRHRILASFASVHTYTHARTHARPLNQSTIVLLSAVLT